MYIVLDLQACQSPGSGRRGIGRYSLALAKAMAAHPRGHRISLLLNGAMDESIEFLRAQFDGLIRAQDIVVWDGLRGTSPRCPGSGFRRLASELLRRDALDALRPDMVHIASLFDGEWDESIATVPAQAPYLTAVTLYDLIPLAQHHYRAEPEIERWYMDKVRYLKQANQLLGISRFSCAEARQLLGVPDIRLTEISAAADGIFRPMDDAEVFRAEIMARYRIKHPFVMYVGGLDPRKNVAALFRAYSRLPSALRQSHQLVIVGYANDVLKKELEKQMATCGLDTTEVAFIGYVPDADLVKLYNLCALYVFASLQEGFGLPPLEAMASGAVVVASHATSLPEVIGMEEALFDPCDDGAISASMLKGLTDAGFRERFHQHAVRQVGKFSWAESARRALEGMEQAFDREHAANRTGVVIGSPVVDEVGHAPTLDIADNAIDADKLLQAFCTSANIRVRGSSVGHVLAELARSHQSLVVEFVYRAAGYPAMREVLDSGFDPAVLSRRVPVQALDAFGQCQLVSVAGQMVGSHWRDKVDASMRALGASDVTGLADPTDWIDFAAAHAASQRAGQVGNRWFVDISHLVESDIPTGTPGVASRVLDALMEQPPEGCRLEPVYLDATGIIRYARSYCRDRYFDGEPLPEDEAVEFISSDVFLGLVSTISRLPAHAHEFHALRARGVKLHFMVYDLLFWLRPDCVDPGRLPMLRAWSDAITQVADGVLCLSRVTADEFERWLHQYLPPRLRPLSIGWFRPGADPVVLKKDAHIGPCVSELDVLKERPTFLMVGAIEPHKGHAQALTAFEHLWNESIEVNLLIIGEPGWLAETLVDRLREHPMRGKRLFWFEQADDDLLLAAYRRAAALLNPSEIEGSGVSLIEAARHGVPLIIRDLPVFRDIAGEHAHYFGNHDADGLAAVVKCWLELDSRKQSAQSTGITWLSWQDAAAQLVDVITGSIWEHCWMPTSLRRFSAVDTRFGTQVGRLVRGRMETTGAAGMLIYGPYLPFPSGRYVIEMYGQGKGTGWLDACSARGAHKHVWGDFNLDAPDVPDDTCLLRMEVSLAQDVADLEIRVGVAADTKLHLSHFQVYPLRSESVSSGE